MDDNLEKLGRQIARLIEDGVVGEYKVCLTMELRDLEEADRVVEEALTIAERNAKSDKASSS